MTRVRLDAAGWQVREDFWEALLPGIGAPEWHGHSLDALFDALVADLTTAKPPLTVEIAGAARTPAALVAYLTRIAEVFRDAEAETGRTFALRFVR